MSGLPSVDAMKLTYDTNQGEIYLLNDAVTPPPQGNTGSIWTQGDGTTLGEAIENFEAVRNTLDGVDDGKISVGEKILNFGKGVVAPVTQAFSSPKNFILTAGAIALGAGIVVATGGAVAPFMVAGGVLAGGWQIGSNAYKIATSSAETDEEARQLWQGVGTGVTTLGLSVAGSKGALSAADEALNLGLGAETINNMGYLEATARCIGAAPKSLTTSFGMAGNAVIGAAASLRGKTPATTTQEPPTVRISDLDQMANQESSVQTGEPVVSETPVASNAEPASTLIPPEIQAIQDNAFQVRVRPAYESPMMNASVDLSNVKMSGLPDNSNAYATLTSLHSSSAQIRHASNQIRSSYKAG